MKKTLLVLPLLVSNLCAQNFILLKNDDRYDDVCGSNYSYDDILSFSFAFDSAKDSVWFKWEHYPEYGFDANSLDNDNNGLSDDYGAYIMIDYNNNLNDGVNTGATSGACATLDNFDMKHDLCLKYIRLASLPPMVTSKLSKDISLSASTIPVLVKTVVIPKNLSKPNTDTVTVIMSTKLSKVNPAKDGKMNIIFGIGGSHEVYDIVPNTGYINTADFVNSISESERYYSVAIHPNPLATGEELRIDTRHLMGELVSIKITDIVGNTVAVLAEKLVIKDGDFKTIINPAISPGIYLCRIESGTGVGINKLVIR